MPLIESLLLLLIVSRMIGEIVERFGQPAMIGEIAAGILLGPSVLKLVHFTPEIRALADLGVLLLVFLAGMEMELDVLWKSFRGRGALVGLSGFLVPLILGIGVGIAFGMDRTREIFVGLCIAITALPVSVRILMDLGKLQTDIGQKIIAAAVMNDVISLLMLGVIVDVKGAGPVSRSVLASLGLALLKAIVFMAGFITVSRLIKRHSGKRFVRSRNLVDRLVVHLKGKESLFAVVFLFVMAFAAFSQILGLDFIVGAFFGSMLLSYAVLGRANFQEVQKTASNVTMGFLGPIFFAAIGLEFDASSLRHWTLVAAVLVAAFASKIFGGYLGGRMAKMSSDESWVLGIGLNGRGIMELVIANIALARGFIDQELFTVLILMATVTTFVTPFLLKRAYSRLPAEPVAIPDASSAAD
ncbi:MAG TPA: cation:proton antiporter [Candidatus Dormibacteraeota bacterium]|nr:cation:proton antiporter [Candidatus Dormibacteraeota bacterium]